MFKDDFFKIIASFFLSFDTYILAGIGQMLIKLAYPYEILMTPEVKLFNLLLSLMLFIAGLGIIVLPGIFLFLMLSKEHQEKPYYTYFHRKTNTPYVVDPDGNEFFSIKELEKIEYKKESKKESIWQNKAFTYSMIGLLLVVIFVGTFWILLTLNNVTL